MNICTIGLYNFHICDFGNGHLGCDATHVKKAAIL